MILALLLACAPENRAWLVSGARVRVLTEAVDFGPVPLDLSTGASLEVENFGDQSTTLSLALVPPFSGPSSVGLDAGVVSEIALGFAPIDGALAEAWLEIGGFEVLLTGSTDPDGDQDGAEHLDLGGDDCDDQDPESYPGADEIWYDGVDQDCAGGDDYDADLDGEAQEPTGRDCDDTDADVNSSAQEIWYDGVDQDCNEGSDYDADGDGYDSVDHGGDDCDDTSTRFSPAAQEVWYDGVDFDCDGGDDYDADGDGDPSEDWGGSDCDDQDPGRSGIFSETEDLVDEDCDGLVDEDFYVVGDLVFTEFLPRPLAVGDPAGEYIELRNVSGRDVDVAGGVLSSGSAQVELPSVTLTAGRRLLLCRSADSADNGGLSCDAEWGSSFGLGRNSGSLSLAIGELELDAFSWDSTWAVGAGISHQLDHSSHDATLNDDPAYWCESTDTSVTGDLGTPGAKNGDC